MRSIKLVIGLAVAVGLMAIVAAPAMAAPSWFECEKTEGKFKNNKFTENRLPNEFEWVQLSKAIPSMSKEE